MFAAADDVRNTGRPDDDTGTGDFPDSQTTAVLQPVCWVAAFAVGLAYTNHSDPTCIEQILGTDASACDLTRAHQLLSGWEVLEGRAHRRALRLIEQALLHVDGDPSPSRPPSSHRAPA